MSSFDPGWVRLVSSLNESLAALDKGTSSIRRTTKRVATEADVEESRTKINGILLSTGKEDIAKIHSILQLVEKYIRLNPAIRVEAGKLVANAQTYLNKFQIACDAFEQRCQSVLNNAVTVRNNRSKYHGGSGSGAGGGTTSSTSNRTGDSNDEGEELLQVQQKGPTQREVFEQQMHEEALRDRTREVKEILENVTDINEIFQHINQLVGEQGEQIDTIAVNVENAEEKTRRGVENLRDAAARQRKTKCLQLSAFFIVFVFIAVVLAIMTA